MKDNWDYYIWVIENDATKEQYKITWQNEDKKRNNVGMAAAPSSPWQTLKKKL